MEAFASIWRSLAILATIAVFTSLYFARDLFLPITASVLIALQLSPVMRAYLGYTAIALPHSELLSVNEALDSAITGLENTAQFWTFNAEGEVLKASMDLDKVNPYLPASNPLVDYVNDKTTVFDDRSASGERRTYALVPIQ